MSVLTILNVSVTKWVNFAFWINQSEHDITQIAKLNQKSKQKLQLLAEMVLFSFNQTTHPSTHLDKYEGGRIEQNLENKSCLSTGVDPKNDHVSNSKIAKLESKTLRLLCFWYNGL